MLHVVYGVYRWKPKRLAFRNDYCLKCEAPQRAVLMRSFIVGHIYWIPILPVGFWKNWSCTICGSDPHVSVKTRRGFKWAGLAILLVASLAVWADSPDSDPDAKLPFWILRLAAPAGAILTLVHLLRTRNDPSLNARLAAIPPAADTLCPFCGTQLLMLASQCSCPGYGVLRS